MQAKKEKLRILEFHVITRILHRKLRKPDFGCGNILALSLLIMS